MAKRIVIFGWAESVHIQRWTAGLRDRGYDIKLISLGGEPPHDIDTTVFPRRGPLAYLRYAGAAARVARAHNPDLVHVHYAAGFGHWGMKTGRRPLLVSVWGSDVERIAARQPYRWFVRRSLRAATALTASSEYLKRQAVRLAPDTADRCTVIPFGVPVPESVQPLPARPPFRLCYLKLHSATYAPDIALRAVAAVADRGVDVFLSLAGSGELTDDLRRLANTLGIVDRVSFPGFIPNREVYAFIQQHHALIMPSRKEAFGVAALEAAACGRPTIGSDVGGIPEVISDRVTGVLAPVDDVEAFASAIRMLAEDNQLLNHLGESARKRVRRDFAWEHSLDAMTALYDRLIAG